VKRHTGFTSQDVKDILTNALFLVKILGRMSKKVLHEG
jgi:hypothetical protein